MATRLELQTELFLLEKEAHDIRAMLLDSDAFIAKYPTGPNAGLGTPAGIADLLRIRIQGVIIRQSGIATQLSTM